MNRKRLLDVLIPTYNRANDLEKNIRLIVSNISQLCKSSDVCIVVVDNASIDDTTHRINKLSEEFSSINIKYHRNESNIGLQANIIKVLQLAEAPYIMFQGDDDFIPYAYWRKVFEIIEGEGNVGVIIPERKRYSSEIFYSEMGGFDVQTKAVKYSPGWKNTWMLAGECNQLSGLVYNRDAMFERWGQRPRHSLYPFMTFAGWSANKFISYKICGTPILITEGVRKDWGYGYDGLLGDILVTAHYVAEDNFFQRCVGEILLLLRWRDRISMYWVMGRNKGIKCISTLLQDNRLAWTTRILIIPLSIILFLDILLMRRLGRFKSPHGSNAFIQK